MKANCPQCGERLRHGRTTRVGHNIARRRDCAACGYADRAIYQPEIILKTLKVRRRQNKVRPRTNDPLNDTADGSNRLSDAG